MKSGKLLASRTTDAAIVLFLGTEAAHKLLAATSVNSFMYALLLLLEVKLSY